LVGDALPVRHRPGAGGADDRELPQRVDMEPHAALSACGGGFAAGWLHGRLAVAYWIDGDPRQNVVGGGKLMRAGSLRMTHSHFVSRVRNK
jgi:hypothetical protein